MDAPAPPNAATLDWPATPGWLACADVLDAAPTPAVVLDLDVARRNIARAAVLAREHGVALRPHVKTHKSLRLAALQRAAGAAGFTAAKPSEAAVFLRAGLPVTVAYPVLRPEVVRMLGDAAGGGEVRFVVDSMPGLHALSSAAQQLGRTIPAYMEVDVGLRRCGVAPDSPNALALAAALARAPGVRFLGLLSHAGQAYAARGPAEVQAIAAAERAALTSLASRLEQHGIPVPERSVGSTPTAFHHDGFAGLTEARPGNYVFMDLIAVALGVAQPADVALQVSATVVSANAAYAIVDAGSKVLSSDRAPHGADTVQGHGLAIPLRGGGARPVVRLSEEHGFVAQDPANPLPVGARVRIVPNHACPVANLADAYLVVDGTGATDHWPVDARGAVQ